MMSRVIGATQQIRISALNIVPAVEQQQQKQREGQGQQDRLRPKSFAEIRDTK